MYRLNILGACCLGADILSDSKCWSEATSVGAEISRFKGQVEKPEAEGDTCRWFSDLEKKAIALVMSECRTRDRSGQNNECMSAKITRLKDHAEFDKAVAGCLSQLPDFAYHMYIEHLNHLESICFHVLSALWQSQTTQTVKALSSTSNAIALKMEQSMEKYDNILMKQEESLMRQEKIISQGRILERVIEGANSKVQSAFDMLALRVTEEHAKVSALFEDIFDGISALTSFQQFLKMKVVDVQSLALYAFLVFVTHHLTSTARTQDARIPIYLVWTVLVVTEIALYRCFVEEHEVRNRINSTLRCIGVFLACTFWFRSMIFYEDPTEKALGGVTSEMQRFQYKLDKLLHKNNLLTPAVKKRSRYGLE